VVDSRAAADFASKAIELDPHDASALAIYGHVQSLMLHDLGTAVQLLDRAIEAGPNNPLAWAMSSATCGYLVSGPRQACDRTGGAELAAVPCGY
jgi:adenylate cyclase